MISGLARVTQRISSSSLLRYLTEAEVANSSSLIAPRYREFAKASHCMEDPSYSTPSRARTWVPRRKTPYQRWSHVLDLDCVGKRARHEGVSRLRTTCGRDAASCGWCDEASYAHGSQPTLLSRPGRRHMNTLVDESGLSRVAHPSPDHDARHFAKPRVRPLGLDLKPASGARKGGSPGNSD